MDVEISKLNFNAVCRQMLQEHKANSPALVDMTGVDTEAHQRARPRAKEC